MEKKKSRKGSRIDVMPVDEIIVMSDDDLKSKLEKLRFDIEKVRSKGDFAVSLEVEYCYLQREAQIRECRAQAHYEYQQRCYEEDRQEYLKELTLPEYKPEPAPRRWWS